MKMMCGEIYKRTISEEATDYFMDYISRDYGVPKLNNALKATKLHVDFHENKKIREVIHKYEKILQDMRSGNNEAHPHQMNDPLVKDQSEAEALNIIYYGCPGVGKTFALRKMMDEKRSKATVSVRDIKKNTWKSFLLERIIDFISSPKNSLKDSSEFYHQEFNTQYEQEIKKFRPNSSSHNSQVYHYYQKLRDAGILSFSDEEPGRYKLEITDNAVPIKNIEFVTFHQSYSYEDFIEGIRPEVAENSSQVSYKVKDGVFKTLCKRARDNEAVNFYIFIDEINRGNVSRVFGELITLLEEDKRLGAKQELRVQLPYSREEFGVPKNVYVYGTMNTADRSVEALDSALRRRFEFREIEPDATHIPHDAEDVRLQNIFLTINARLVKLLDREHRIGHAWLMNLDSLSSVKNAFKVKIIPLLMEYFIGDVSKVRLVLGNAFVKKESNVRFAVADDEGENGDATYRLLSDSEWNGVSADSFNAIINTAEQE